jgi:hypothetical protein
MEEILLAEIRNHPYMQVNDLYKFLHQAAFGSEHAIHDREGVRKWMETEVAGLDLSIIDPLFDRLSPDGVMVRVNLRPWIKAGHNPSVLLEAFINTANSRKGSADVFIQYWKTARQLAEKGMFRFSERKMDRFINRKEKDGLPAVHHTWQYERKYHPAYRVVDSQFLRDLI